MGTNIHHLNRPDDSRGKRELERKRVREFEKDGSGSSHGREATHTYHKGLTHLVGTRLWDSDLTLGLLSRMCCLPPEPDQSGASKSLTTAFTTGATVTGN